MKQIVVALTLLLSFVLLGCVSQIKSPMEGAWQLVSGTNKWGDTTYDYAKMGYDGMKIWSDHRFIFVGRLVQNGKTMDNYGGGSFTLAGNNYTEVITYFPLKTMIGDTIPYEIQVNNDTLIQKGPLKIGKYRDTKWELYEVYHRLK
jgi:hypothetical protein